MTSGGDLSMFHWREVSFRINLERAKDYLNTRERLYVVDGFAGWDPAYRIKIRIICSRPYHALFMHTMLIRPPRRNSASYGEPDYVIYNAGAFPANRLTVGMSASTSIDVSFENREMGSAWNRVCRRNEKGGVYDLELLDAKARPAVHALLRHCRSGH